MAEEREVSVAATFDFPLVAFGSTNANFTTGAVAASGDVQLSQDTGAFFTVTNSTVMPHKGNGIYSIALTSTEMAMARGTLTIIDASSTKVWEDQAILIATYGSTVALHRFNRNSSGPNVTVDLINAGKITSTAFAAGAINSTAIAAAALIAEKFGAGFLTSTGFAAGAINDAAIAAGAISSTQIADNAITAGKIASNAMTTDQIADGVFDRIDSGVNTQMLDVLTVDTFTEPITTTDAPPVSNTIANKIGYLYGTYVNRLDVSTAAKTYYTSTGGIAFTKAVSDTGIYTEQAASTA